MFKSPYSYDRKNLLRAIQFEKPDHIPMCFSICPSCWDCYDQNALLDLIDDHPFLFPEFQRPATPIKPVYPKVARAGKPYRDDFGCVWETTVNDIVGSVHKHPLENLDDYADYRLPDPEHSTGLGPINWTKFEKSIQREKAEGLMTYGTLRHGHTFLQLCDIR